METARKGRKKRFLLLYDKQEERFRAFYGHDLPIGEWHIDWATKLSEHLVKFEGKYSDKAERAFEALCALDKAMCNDSQLSCVLEGIFMMGFHARGAHDRKKKAAKSA